MARAGAEMRPVYWPATWTPAPVERVEPVALGQRRLGISRAYCDGYTSAEEGIVSSRLRMLPHVLMLSPSSSSMWVRRWTWLPPRATWCARGFRCDSTTLMRDCCGCSLRAFRPSADAPVPLDSSFDMALSSRSASIFRAKRPRLRAKDTPWPVCCSLPDSRAEWRNQINEKWQACGRTLSKFGFGPRLLSHRVWRRSRGMVVTRKNLSWSARIT